MDTIKTHSLRRWHDTLLFLYWKLKNVFEVSVEIQNAYVIKDTVSPYKKNIFMRV